ncbi:hypothetical protein NL30_19450 [Burkholderia contaminans]|nr:hypothetical protein NL30_19450 [Burkholderia contaminans]
MYAEDSLRWTDQILTFVGLHDGEMQWAAHCRMFAETAWTSLRGKPGRKRISSASNGCNGPDADRAAGLTFGRVIAGADDIHGRIDE